MRTLLVALLGGFALSGCDGGEPADTGGKNTSDDVDRDGFSGDADCNDENAAINPDAAETCDGVDNDCDGSVDEDGATNTITFYADADGDGYGYLESAVAACDAPEGYVEDATDCDDTNGAINPGATEVCDDADADEDCDGAADDADPEVTGTSSWYADADGDTYGDAGNVTLACSQPAGTVADNHDCDDGDGTINPAGTEACDGADNDCDGVTDESGATGEVTLYADDDGDGYGDANDAITACEQAGRVTDATDCDDANSAANPGASEVCDGADNDCDGLVDDDDDSVSGLTTWYADEDGDGYGDPNFTYDACDAPAGFIADGTDCDDDDAAVNPLATEVCNDLDDNCDGYTDDEDSAVSGTTTWYADADGDGYGDATAASVVSCDQPSGYGPGTDCDDTSASVSPAGTEVCDAADADEDCDGLADDADDSVSDATTWYIDSDGDGGGDSDTSVVACDQPSGYVDNSNDPYENAAFADFSSDADLEEVADVVVGSSAIYAVGYNSDGDAAVVSIDPTTGAVTEIWAGLPLTDPTGVALSADGMTLYVADVAAETTLGTTAGDVYEVDVAGGGASAMGAEGTIDMPGDVTMSSDGSTLYVTGLNASGDAAIFSIDAGTGAVAEVFSGDPLVDPAALDLSPDDATLYVVDSLAADGLGAVLVFGVSGWTYDDELASGFDIAFPGGVAADDSGSMLLYTSISSGALTSLMTDGSGFEVLDTSSLLDLPAGVAVSGEMAYVADLSSDASSDVFLLTY